MIDEHRLVGCVGAFADCSHAIERCDAQGRGEVAIRGAAGACFGELPVDFSGVSLGAAKELHGAAGALHWRAIDTAFEGERASGFGSWLERGEALLNAWAVGAAGDTDINFGPGFGGNNVGFAAAANDSDIDRGAAFQVSKGA